MWVLWASGRKLTSFDLIYSFTTSIILRQPWFIMLSPYSLGIKSYHRNRPCIQNFTPPFYHHVAPHSQTLKPFHLEVHNQQDFICSNSLNVPVPSCSDTTCFSPDYSVYLQISQMALIIFYHTDWDRRCEGDFLTPRWCLEIILDFSFLFFYLESPWIKFNTFYIALY